MDNLKKIKFIFFEESWNHDNGKEQEEQARPNRRREVHNGGAKPISPPQDDAKESRR